MIISTKPPLEKGTYYHMRKQIYSFQCDPEDLVQLKALGVRLGGLNTSAVVRLAVKEYLRKHAEDVVSPPVEPAATSSPARRTAEEYRKKQVF